MRNVILYEGDREMYNVQLPLELCIVCLTEHAPMLNFVSGNKLCYTKRLMMLHTWHQC